jgi:hypothetical protein
MKTALVLFSLLATSAIAQDNQAIHAKRVVSVTWDSQTSKLSWVVQEGLEQNGDFAVSSEERYEISPKDAVMAAEGTQRTFTDTDPTRLWNLLRALTLYCAQSTVWWDNGQSVPTDPGKPTAQPPADPSKPKPAVAPGTAPTKVVDFR